MCDIFICGSVCVKVNFDFCFCCSVDVFEIIFYMEFDIDFNGVVSEEDINIIIKIEVKVNFYIDIFICKYVIYLVLNL